MPRRLHVWQWNIIVVRAIGQKVGASVINTTRGFVLRVASGVHKPLLETIFVVGRSGMDNGEVWLKGEWITAMGEGNGVRPVWVRKGAPPAAPASRPPQPVAFMFCRDWSSLF
jgi:hypothetical protein